MYSSLVVYRTDPLSIVLDRIIPERTPVKRLPNIAGSLTLCLSFMSRLEGAVGPPPWGVPLDLTGSVTLQC